MVMMVMIVMVVMSSRDGPVDVFISTPSMVE
jgi:hypothetical protein